MSSDKKRVTFNHQEESQHRIDKSVKKCQDWLKSLDSNDHSHLHIDTFKPVIRLKITDGNSSSNPLIESFFRCAVALGRSWRLFGGSWAVFG